MIALHLLRHAHAGDATRWSGDDDERPLTEKGIRQCERLGRALSGIEDPPDRFLASPRLRASQTAQVVAGILGVGVRLDERLAEPLDLDVVSDILRDAGGEGRPCLVGHDPDFSEVLEELLGVASIAMRKAAIARVDVDGLPLAAGTGVLRWLLPPELLAGR